MGFDLPAAALAWCEADAEGISVNITRLTSALARILSSKVKDKPRIAADGLLYVEATTEA
jgi:hypothetical protein